MLLESHALDYRRRLYAQKVSVAWSEAFAVACFTQEITTSLPPSPHKKNSKNPTLLKHMRAFKRLDTQTIHFIVASKSQQTPPKDRELFDNVYNRHPKAAEVHQMLREDGALWSPPRQNEVRYKIRFLEAQSDKRATKILIYLLGLTKLDTSGGGGKRTTHRRLSKGRESLNLTVQCFNGLSHGWFSPFLKRTECVNNSKLLAIPMMYNISTPGESTHIPT